MTWMRDMQQEWDTAPTVPQVEEWGPPHHFGDCGEARYSKPKTVTFKLNAEIPNQPFFTEEVDYTSIQRRSIIPEPEDILDMDDTPYDQPHSASDRRFQPLPRIPINRVNGEYESAEQYLYTHFELMRNDALIPLRNAVKYYKESISRNKEDPSFADRPDAQPMRRFRLYEHVSSSLFVCILILMAVKGAAERARVLVATSGLSYQLPTAVPRSCIMATIQASNRRITCPLVQGQFRKGYQNCHRR